MATQSPVSNEAPTARAVREAESIVIRFCGDSGDGMQLTGSEFTKSSAIAGNDLSTLPDFPAEIRAPAGTLAGVSGFQLQFSSLAVYTPGDQPDVLVAMNPAALKTNLPDLTSTGTLIVNTAAFTKPNLTKAGYESNPIEDGSIDKYKTYKVDITGLTKMCLKDSGLNSKGVDRCKNFFALGMTFWMFNRPTGPQVESIRKKFGKKPEIAEANIQVFKAGYHYGETAEIFTESVHVKPADIAPGRYRNIMGNSATAVGLVTGCQLANLDLFYAGYPITPASTVLHELAKYRAFGVTTFQAEDEIAAMSAAVGGAFGGSLGVTASSGPGIALKGEAMGLAAILELPLVIVNVQRGGPSTGLPTKTEQADLMQAMYGRNGECPLPIIAARTPADCFYAAIEAVRIATQFMTPVMLLTDGYLANGAEPWKLPKKEDLKPFPKSFRTEVPEDGYKAYARNEEFLARDWVKPGTPGLAHRVGGLEKDRLTGNVSYDPDNHEYMCHIRQKKVDKVAEQMGELFLDGEETGDVLLVGWGSTYGAIAKATANLREEGVSVSHCHLRWISPFHPDLGKVLRGHKKVIVPEMNLGQLVKLLRAEFLVDAEGLNKIQGKPFKVSEIVDKVKAYKANGSK
jgi:2-oxoglutarate/2-oxoacid ferredoxin oxidoreductase subunit alpha